MTTDYNELSDSYGQTKISPLRKYVDEFTLLKVLGNIRGKSVLDLACGDGHYTRLAKAQGAATVVGVDISPAMIDAARAQEQQSPLGLEYQVQDVIDLGEIGRFDIALAVYLFPYAASREQLGGMGRSIYRNLTAGGRLVAATLNPAVTEADLPGYQQYGVNVTAPSGLQDGTTVKASLDIPDGAVDISAHYWSRSTYDQVLKEAGFQDITWQPMAVSQEAIRRYGRDYWQTYQAKALDTVLACQKM